MITLKEKQSADGQRAVTTTLLVGHKVPEHGSELLLHLPQLPALYSSSGTCNVQRLNDLHKADSTNVTATTDKQRN